MNCCGQLHQTNGGGGGAFVQSATQELQADSFSTAVPTSILTVNMTTAAGFLEIFFSGTMIGVSGVANALITFRIVIDGNPVKTRSFTALYTDPPTFLDPARVALVLNMRTPITAGPHVIDIEWFDQGAGSAEIVGPGSTETNAELIVNELAA